MRFWQNQQIRNEFEYQLTIEQIPLLSIILTMTFFLYFFRKSLSCIQRISRKSIILIKFAPGF